MIEAQQSYVRHFERNTIMLDNPTLLEKLFPEVLSRYALKGVELAAT
jgi:hypothetical protein